MMINPYEVLGLANDADKSQVKKAYRQLAKKYHPNINKELGAAECMKKINEAYDMIMKEYRPYEPSIHQPQPTFSYFNINFDEIYSTSDYTYTAVT